MRVPVSAAATAGASYVIEESSGPGTRLIFKLAPAPAGEAFFQGLGELLAAGAPDPARLAAYAEPLGTVFVGPPLDAPG